MGREANCSCTLDGKRFEVKAKLEPTELILRGGIHRRIPFAEMRGVKAEAELLSFRIGSDHLHLALGMAAATRWAQTILAPLPTLAKKLGIDDGTRVRVIGTVDDVALQEAFVCAHLVARGKADVVLARVNTHAELNEALIKAAAYVENGAALWLVYRKGPGQAINESNVRAAGLAAGIVDVKVASVSVALTALKFLKRKKPKPGNS